MRRSTLNGRADQDLAPGVELRRSAPRSTDTPEFKRWFGDSKVVDENGEPLVVYHGTTRKFDEFKIPAYFVSNRRDAEYFSASRKPTVVDAYLSIENPVTIDDFYGFIDWTERDVRKWESLGYDGAVLRKARPSEPSMFIAFKPTQIKSATGNRGTFDPANPKITMSRRRDAMDHARGSVSRGRVETVKDAGSEHQIHIFEASTRAGLALDHMARVFGKRLVLFRSETLDVDGFVRNNDDLAIYINIDSQVSPLAVFGHELTHLLRRDNPEAYAAIQAVVETELREGAMRRFAWEYGQGADIEELTSDLVGNRFQEPEFWRAVFAELSARDPDRAVGFMERVVDLINQMIEAFVESMRRPGFMADSYVKDLEAVRDAAKSALAQYARARSIGHASPTVNEAADDATDRRRRAARRLGFHLEGGAVEPCGARCDPERDAEEAQVVQRASVAP